MRRTAHPRPRLLRGHAGVPALATLCIGSLALGSCASGSGTASAGATSDAEWAALAAPRPEPLPGAARVSFGGIEMVGATPWTFDAGVSPNLAVSELVVAGLLRRRDVQLVERRRFGAAVEAEAAGTPRPPAAPVVGVSPGAELIAAADWLPVGSGQVALEVRLSDAETGALAGGRRMLLPDDADPVGTARAVVASLLAALGDQNRLPEWSDPLSGVAAPAEYRPSGVPAPAVQQFVSGLASEDRWNWDEARRSYQSALENPGFVEAEAALARTARLRSGGTLGDS